MIRRFARPYAQALLRTAGSLEATVAVRDELAAFRRAMEEVPGIARMAANPAVPSEVKERVVEQVAEAVGASPLARRFLALLLRNYRLGQLPAVVDTLEDLLNRRLGIAIAEVTTAEALSEAERNELEKTLERLLDRDVELKLAVDPALMAGFVARVGSDLYDASLRGQLHRLASRMAEA